MNWRILVLILILADFSALSLYAMYHHGYFGIWQAGLTNWATIQILTDLVIVCLLISSWMIRDARERGATAWPYVLITLAAGSFGPLLYLLQREWALKVADQTSMLPSR